MSVAAPYFSGPNGQGFATPWVGTACEQVKIQWKRQWNRDCEYMDRQCPQHRGRRVHDETYQRSGC